VSLDQAVLSSNCVSQPRDTRRTVPDDKPYALDDELIDKALGVHDGIGSVRFPFERSTFVKAWSRSDRYLNAARVSLLIG
jgi:hypothetical protein